MPTRPVVTLRDERDERDDRDRRHLAAYLDERGDLHIDGQDLGPGTSSVSEDGEYEWFRTIAAADLPRLLQLLGADPGETILAVLSRKYTGPGSYELERLLRDNNFPSTLRVW